MVDNESGSTDFRDQCERTGTMRHLFLILGLLSIVVLATTGCAPTSGNPAAVSLFQAPAVQAVRSPSMESGQYDKFTAIPVAEETEESGMHPQVESQLLYLVRNELESLGYKHVETTEQADFVVRLTYSNDFERGEVARSKMEISSGLKSAFGRSSRDTPASYCPKVSIKAIDAQGDEEIWSGSTLALTPEADIRRSATRLLPPLFHQHFPISEHVVDRLDSRDGFFGCDITILTTNGNDYFPIVTGLIDQYAPAKGKLRLYDIITEIDGDGTRNRPYSEIRAALDKAAGEMVSLRVLRDGKAIERVVTAGEEAKVKYLILTVADFGTGGKRFLTENDVMEIWPELTREDVLNMIP